VIRTTDRRLGEVAHYCGQSGVQYYEYQSQWGEIAGQIIARKFERHIRPSDVVLDFGCGGGFVLNSLACHRRLGVEINPIARRAAETREVDCFETLDDIENGLIDVAISHHSLEHVPSPLGILREIQRKLKPGGLLLAVVPIDDWRNQKRYDPTDISHHLYTWTPLLLGHLLYEAGFDCQTLSTTIGINGWFRAFPHLVGRFPQPCLDVLLFLWCALRRTREIYAVIRKPSADSPPL